VHHQGNGNGASHRKSNRNSIEKVNGAAKRRAENKPIEEKGSQQGSFAAEA
jgi:hypothetical protein